MSVEQTNVIDIIGTDEETSAISLMITDHLDWESEEGEHLLLLQEKINTYLSYVEGGQILEKFPDARGKPVTIIVACKYPPSKGAMVFFNRAKVFLANAGFRLEIKKSEDKKKTEVD